MALGQAAGDEALVAGRSFGTGARARWILRRLAVSVVVLVGVSLLVFAATQALPSDPAVQILGRSAAPEQLDALRQELGLDRPLVSPVPPLGRRPAARLARRVARHARAGRRRSSATARSTRFALVLLSALIAVPLALLLGTLGAIRRDRRVRPRLAAVLLVITALPEFVVGLDPADPLLDHACSRGCPAVAIIPPGDSAFAHPKELALPVLTLVLAVLPYLDAAAPGRDGRRARVRVRPDGAAEGRARSAS